MMGKSFSIDGKSNRPSRNFGGRHNLDNRFAVTITNNSIVWLKIQGQGLRSLPENIGDLTHLRQLHINYNPIVELPESIGKLQQLTELNVAFNNLIRLPESIGDLTNLRSLSAFSNRLRSLPRTLLAFKNKRVEILVWHNPIELSPEEKVLFSQMKIKIVWDNRIDINPSKFASMSDSEKREHVNRLNNEIDALQRRMGTEDLSRGRERETFLSIMYKLKEIYYLTPTLKLEKINS
jgi:Leucine-rich repeat (LRR) protein